MEKDTGSGQCQLRQLQEDASLDDKIHALRSAASLLRNGELVEGGGRAVDLGIGEEPLAWTFGLHGDQRLVDGWNVAAARRRAPS